MGEGLSDAGNGGGMRSCGPGGIVLQQSSKQAGETGPARYTPARGRRWIEDFEIKDLPNQPI